MIGKFLGDVRDIAMRQLDAPVSECVISVPSGGSPDEIQMIVKAAKEAGFSHVHPLRECVAIALGHNMCENDAEDDDYYDRMLVCTINVGYYSSEYSIMDIHQGCIKVLASERCPIGGERMTGKLYEEVKTRFCAVNGIKTSDLNMRAQKKLFHACEVSKKSLLVKGSGPVLCESLYDGNDCNIPMSVQKIEACCSDVFKESAANITKFLSNNSITLESITHVIFAGGGMRMQKLQSICKSIFPASTEIIVSPEPEKSVMQGCRLCGHKLSIAPHASSKIKVIGTSIEICALKSPLSILLKHGKTLEIFPERTIIPAFRKIALTLNKDQKTIHVILGNKTPLAEVVLNTSAVSSGNANAHLLIVFESKSLITIGVVSNDTTVDSVDIDLSSRAIPPVTAAV